MDDMLIACKERNEINKGLGCCKKDTGCGNDHEQTRMDYLLISEELYEEGVGNI